MSNAAKDRIEALSKQLSHRAPATDSNGASAPKQIAGPSNGPPTRREGTNSLLGIGRAAAYQFAESGALALYLCDFDDSNLASHQRDLQKLYPDVDVHTRRFDAASSSAVKAVVDDAVKRYGRLDVFFANAGIVGTPTHFTDVEKSEFMQVMETNAASVFLAAKHAAPAMTVTSSTKPASGGSIIGTASVAGLRSNAGPTAYSAAKAAVVSMAQTCAYQLAGTGIRVNAVCPGMIETGMTAPTFEAARARGTERKIGQLNPLKRGGQADEIARVALFLASDEASYVNGQAWAVDGGLSAGHPFVPGKLA
ncbi:hypothetical protein PG993_007850 [Apiospora rasikravindrae]|uniref:Uncharacterized protein n=1 Tax=Apiospora rasikravindrae TaxID=990691 RepID=A0ABR1T0I3_9PEZI